MELTTNMLLGGLLVGVTLVCLVPILGGFLHYRRDRLLTHAERIKALEMGRDLPDDAATARLKAVYGSPDKPEGAPSGQKSLAVQCYTTTGWVAGLGLLFAMWAGSGPTGNAGVAFAIAASAGAIGVTGMICGTILASKAPSSEPTPSMAISKPRFDPEAV